MANTVGSAGARKLLANKKKDSATDKLKREVEARLVASTVAEGQRARNSKSSNKPSPKKVVNPPKPRSSTKETTRPKARPAAPSSESRRAATGVTTNETNTPAKPERKSGWAKSQGMTARANGAKPGETLAEKRERIKKKRTAMGIGNL